MSDVFISYSRKDKEFVHKLHDALVARQRDTWVDWEDIPPTADWLAEIHAAIEAADTFVFVLTPDSIASQICGEEVAHAVNNNKRLMPIVCREVDPKTVNPTLSHLNWIFFRASDDFGAAFETLLKALDTDLDWVRTHTRLLTRAVEWDSKKRNDAFVLRGADLRAAEEWLAQAATGKEPKPTPLQSEYILASRKAATRQQRTLLAGVTLALIVAIVLVVVAVFQWNAAIASEAKAISSAATAVAERNVAQSRELAAHALAQLSVDPELSTLLAIEAVKAAHTVQADDALRQTFRQWPLLTVLRGHTGSVNSARFSPDDQSIVTASNDTTARVWNVSTGKELFVLRGHTQEVTSAQFSPNGRTILTASNDNTARLWDASTGKQLAILRGYRAQFSPDGSRIVTANSDSTAVVWDAGAGEELTVLRGHTNLIVVVGFSPDSQRVITSGACVGGSGDCDPTVRVWDASTGQQLFVLRGHKSWVESAQFSQDGTRIVTASDDGDTRLWDASTGKQLANMRGYSAGFSPDGKKIVTDLGSNTAGIWDASTGKQLTELRGHAGRVITAEFSPDSKQIVTTGGCQTPTNHNCDGTARVWDANTGKELTTLQGHRQDVSSAQFSHDGKQIVTASFDGYARIWDTTGKDSSVAIFAPLSNFYSSIIADAEFSPDSKQIVTLKDPMAAQVWDVRTATAQAFLKGHTAQVISAHFSPDGRQVVTTSVDGTARVWDANDGKEVVVLRGHKFVVTSAQFSPDGKQVVTAGGCEDRQSGQCDSTARIWDVNTGKEVFVLRGHPYEVRTAQFSPDGATIATSGGWDAGLRNFDSTVRVWDASTGKNLFVLSGFGPQFSPTGNQIATIDYGSSTNIVRLWDVRTGKELGQLRGHSSSINGVQFSPDGKQVITCSVDGTARVWDAITGQELAVLRGHMGEVFSAQFSPDGKRIVTAGRDNTVRMWDLTGKEVSTWIEPAGGSAATRRSAKFSPDGKLVVTRSGTTARIYIAQIEDLVALAQTRLTRDLTCRERETYLHEVGACPSPTPPPTPKS